MKILDKYIYKEMTLPIIFGMSLFTFIFLIDVLSEMMENIIVKSVPISDVLEIVSYTFPPVLVQTIPMGVLLGVMISYGSLSGNTEIIAMESIGVGMKRFFMPALTIGVLVMAFLFLLEEQIVPSSHKKLSLLMKKISYKKPTIKLDEKTFIENIGGYSIYLNTVDNDAGEAGNVVIFNKNNNQTLYPQILLAEKAKWLNQDMVMENGKFFDIKDNGELNLKGSFDNKVIPVSTFFSGFNSEMGKDISMMGITELKNEIKANKEKKLPTLAMEIEFQQKMSTPFTSVILAILGVLLSVKNKRSGKGVSFGISLVIIFLYIMGINFGRLMASNKVVSPEVGLWYPNMVLLTLTLVLFIVNMRRR